jgi:hypothetical protein
MGVGGLGWMWWFKRESRLPSAVFSTIDSTGKKKNTT